MSFEIRQGDALQLLRAMPADSVQCCITSPPYWGLRSYLPAAHSLKSQEMGMEPTPEAYVSRMVEVFREVRRVMRPDGTLWLNLGDSYANGNTSEASNEHPSRRQKGTGATDGMRPPRNIGNLKAKDLVGIPWRVAFALQADGWWLRSDIVWAKPNPMPESVRDRPTKSHEYLFLLSKSARYFYDADAIAEPGVWGGQNRSDIGPVSRPMPGAPPHRGLRAKDVRDKQRGHSRRHDGFNDRWDHAAKREQCAGPRNARSVWTISPQPFAEAHFAVMPEALAERCVLAGSRPGDLVLDPFSGAGTVGVVAMRHGRRFVGLELNAEYVAMARRRIAGPLFAALGPEPEHVVKAAQAPSRPWEE